MEVAANLKLKRAMELANKLGARYTLIIGVKRIPVNAGEEYVIPRGVLHAGEVTAGTRTIHAFGGHRANRIVPLPAAAE